jgi:hypothetical protein
MSEFFGPGHFVGLGLGLRLKSEIRTRTRTWTRTKRNRDFPTPWPKIWNFWNFLNKYFDFKIYFHPYIRNFWLLYSINKQYKQTRWVRVQRFFKVRNFRTRTSEKSADSDVWKAPGYVEGYDILILGISKFYNLGPGYFSLTICIFLLNT